MKKLLFLLLSCFLFVTVSISATDEFSNVTIKSTETTELDNGVIFDKRVISSNYETNPVLDRDVFSYTIPGDAENVKLATWTYSSKNGYTNKTLMEIAKDYEEKHPGWIVLGGVNSEGYIASAAGSGSTYELTNAFIQDGDVIRKDVSGETLKELIGFKEDRSHVIKRLPDISEYLNLKIYEADEIIESFPVKYLNALPTNNEIALLTPALKESLDLNGYTVIKGSYDMYRVSTAFPDGPISGSNYGVFVKGKIVGLDETKTISKVINEDFYLVTNNQEVLNYLTSDRAVKCQYDYLNEFADVESMVGYWFKFVENGVVIDKNYTNFLEYENRYDAAYGSHSYWSSTTKERAGIGFKDDGSIVLMTANTRNFGPTQYEMGQYFKMMGCNNAYQFDGGGSVTFIKRNDSGSFDMLNTPGDGSPRSILSGLFIVIPSPVYNVTAKLGSNSLRISAELVDDSNYNIEKSYIQVVGNDQNNQPLSSELQDISNEIVYENLKSNTTYSYYIYYKIGENIKRTYFSGSFQTLKASCSVRSVSVGKDEGGYLFSFSLNDPDRATQRVYVSVNDSEYSFVTSNKIVIDEINGAFILDNIKVKILYDNGDGISQEVIFTEFSVNYDVFVLLDIIATTSSNELDKIVGINYD